MSRRSIAFLAAALTAISLIGAPAASAAAEFGDNCAGNEVSKSDDVTFFALTAPGNPLPLTAPGAGVITKLKSNIEPGLPPVPHTLRVLRQTGAKTVQLVGEASGVVSAGTNTFDSRIPVQAGDRLGFFGPSGAVIYCNVPGAKNPAGAFEGGIGVGGSTPFVEVGSEGRIPVFAVLEPDADNDGFGDETQDKCPQNAAVQVPCPVVALSTSGNVKKGLATVLVTSNLQTPVTVAGSVTLGKGKTAKLNGGTQIVTPGAIAKFTLLFPQKLKAKLKELGQKRFLWLNLTSTAPNLVGPATASGLKVKLKGQAKPKAKAKKPRRQAKS